LLQRGGGMLQGLCDSSEFCRRRALRSGEKKYGKHKTMDKSVKNVDFVEVGERQRRQIQRLFG
jgi:hypothetical protein